MRIAFIGKGGSGKTSTCAAFLLHARNQAANTIAFDVDINAHLAHTLGIAPNKGSLIERSKEVFNSLEPRAEEFLSTLGTRPDIGALPVSDNTTFITCSPNDSFLREFATFDRGMWVLTAGSYSENEVGNVCYHAKLFSSQLVAHRLLDSTNDIIAFDATAGTDPVATSLLHAYDLCVVVVEPTLKSISVYRDFIQAADTEQRTVVIGNKIRSDADKEFIQQQIPASCLLGFLQYSRDVRSAEQGDPDGILRFSESNATLFDTLITKGKQYSRDKHHYFTSLHSWFSTYAKKWYDPLFDNKISGIHVPVPARFAAPSA